MASLLRKWISRIAVLLIAISVCEGELWYKVLVSEARVGSLPKTKSKMTLELNTGLTTYTPYPSICSSFSWCQLFCFNEAAGITYLSEIIVKPGYQETDLSDVLTCYTKLKNDYAVRSPIGGVQPNYASISEPLEALVDGTYNYRNGDCFKSLSQVNPFIYVDLKYPRMITTVEMEFQPGNSAPKMYNLIVRLHPEGPIPTNPDSGEYFGALSRPANPGERLTLKGMSKPYFRYVTIQRVTEPECDVVGGTSPLCSIRFCHLEIY